MGDLMSYDILRLFPIIDTNKKIYVEKEIQKNISFVIQTFHSGIIVDMHINMIYFKSFVKFNQEGINSHGKILRMGIRESTSNFDFDSIVVENLSILENIKNYSDFELLLIFGKHFSDEDFFLENILNLKIKF